MKFIRQTVTAATLLIFASSTWAWWGSNNYQGEVVADKGTQLRTTSKASKTWDDWVWRGKQDGSVISCSSNSKECSYTWRKTKSTSYAHTIGWSVGGGFGFSKSVFNASVEAQYQQERTWTQGQSESFDTTTVLKPGQWAQPVIIAVRRWKKGHFYGAHFLDNVPRSNRYNYTYDWTWKNYGSWQGNEREWGYQHIHVVNNRNSL